jgi:indolepyruvate ferredoxin oxidoreductase, beta subunit
MKLSIVCAGIGGRGVLLASTIIIEAAIRAGYHAIASDEYGMSQRGGSVVSVIKVGDCRSPLIGRESADILLAFEESEFYRTMTFLKRGGLAIINTDRGHLPEAVAGLLETREVKCRLIDADSMAGRNGMAQAANMAVLGYFASISPEVFTFENIEGTIREKVSAKFLAQNLAVFQEGFEAAGGGETQ